LGPTRWNSGPGRLQTNRVARESDQDKAAGAAPCSRQTDEPSADRRRRAGPGPPPLSLSSSRIKMATPTEASFFRRFLSNAEMRHPVAHRRLAAIWLRHWAIPRVWLIYTSLRFFCPGFWHHRRTPSSATADHVGDLCPSPVRACSTASRRWQAVAGKLPSSAPNPRGVLVQLWS
jgi:hypothetical protein